MRIEVADTGVGLTREECDRLFTPYYTSKQHGTGLGLAIVQSVISDHGGTISVRSQPEQARHFWWNCLAIWINCTPRSWMDLRA